MRTDPRAEDVRALVEEVFTGFLGEDEPPRAVATFPRLYEPRLDSSPELKRRVAVSADKRPPARRGGGPEIDETILIDEGRYVARSYRAAGWLAMWLVAVGIVQFYDASGQMRGTINLFESLRPKRMVA